MHRFTDYLILLAVLVAMIVLFGMVRDTFWSFATLGNIAWALPWPLASECLPLL